METDYDSPQESRREKILASLALAQVADVETRFRRFLDSHGGAPNEWDQRFLDFIDRHRGAPFLAGTAGGGFDFVFSSSDATGFWVVEGKDGSCGKGFLGPHDADLILDLARQKGLVR